jgi:N-acetylglucosamine-6-sulfatase
VVLKARIFAQLAIVGGIVFGLGGVASRGLPGQSSQPLNAATAWSARDVPQRPTERARPNVVLVISDDHRWDGLGAAGNPHVVTPHLDQLATEGVHFVQATIHVPQCSPSRAQLLTGLPPHQHGQYSNQVQRRDVVAPDGFKQYTLLPSLLGHAEYRTVFVGKWHLAPEPWNCGFSDVRTWLPEGGGRYRDLALAQGRSRETRPMSGFVQQVFADSAIEFLKSPDARRQPFFLWLAFTAPHGPHVPNPPHIERLYAGRTRELLEPPAFRGEGHPRKWAPYYEAISYLDEQVGRILQTLTEERLADNTIVVFLGDNGFMMGSRDWDGKVLPYEDSIRVPFIVRAPSIATIRGKSRAAVSSLDLPPTILRWTGVSDVPKAWPGRDLTPALRGEAAGFDAAISEFADHESGQFGQYAYRLIRTPQHKLILWERPGRGDELYDLERDPHETKNAIDDSTLADVRENLRRRLEKWMRETDDSFRR